ncbi:MAG: hypothetical protein Q8835_03215, partial [Sweet potato little leaf phytoplasma]|nr:hypothetical protein [Sweet potato little leaf phytoplasma]
MDYYVEPPKLFPLCKFQSLSSQSTYERPSLGFLRNKLAKDLNLIDPQKLSLLWIIDFPLLIF